MNRNYPYYYYNGYDNDYYRGFSKNSSCGWAPPRKIDERYIQRFYGSYPIFRNEASISSASKRKVDPFDYFY